MDLISHGILGAATAQAVARRDQVRVASAAGFAAALLPDADAFLRSGSDPLMVLEWHRHFTHSLLFIPAGALVAALLLWPLLRSRLSFPRLYRYTFAGYALAGLLDASTSYGTHLLWPFSDARTAWSIISVVDPLFTVLVTVPVAYAFLRGRAGAGHAALLLAGAYLSLGIVQHQRALAVAGQVSSERGLQAARIEVKPTLGNLLLWRAMIVSGDRLHVDAVWVGVARTRVYRGESAPLVDPLVASSAPRGSTARRDLARLAYLSDGLLTHHPRDAQLIGDARYAMLPTSLTPIWSIRLDPERPDEHAQLVVDRGTTPELRRCFLQMVFGREPRACAPSGDP